VDCSNENKATSVAATMSVKARISRDNQYPTRLGSERLDVAPQSWLEVTKG
jgi:hypothetical protein